MSLKLVQSGILFASLIASFCAPRTNAQTSQIQQTSRHHHYKLIDVGTLGGPNSFVPFGGTKTINSTGTVIIEDDTSVPDPFSPNCFQFPDCVINHSLKQRNDTPTDLGALPGPNSSFPTWINSHGWVAGMSENGIVDPLTGFPETEAVLWKRDEIIHLGTLGGNVSEANAVNNHGQVVGGALNTTPDAFPATFVNSFIPFTPGFFFFNVATEVHAFLWQDGTMNDLGTLGGPDSVAWYVNDSAQVAGQSTIDSIASPTTGVPPVHPFLWQNGTMKDLGTLGGTFSWPSDLNNRGQVVGASNVAGDLSSHPFLWSGEALKDLGTFGGTTGVANAINDAGDIAGWASTQDPAAVLAFHWRNGVLIDLGTVAGDLCSVANGINSAGQVVGESSADCSFNFPNDRAVLWDQADEGIDLNTLIPPGSSLNLAIAFSINNRAEINGEGFLVNGERHAVLLIPCDENHPDIEGCDYSLQDVSTTAALAAKAASIRSTVNPDKLLGAGLPAYMHSRPMMRYGRFGVVTPK